MRSFSWGGSLTYVPQFLNLCRYDVFETKAALPTEMQMKYPTVGLKSISPASLRTGDVYIVPAFVRCAAATKQVPAGVRVRDRNASN